MPVGPPTENQGVSPDAGAAAARGRRVRVLSAALLADTMADIFVADDARLDDRTRAMVRATLAGIIASIADDIRRQAGRLLEGRGAIARAATVLSEDDDVAARLARSSLLRDAELFGELVARVRQDLIGEDLPTAGAAETPSLVVRLSSRPDSIVASAAVALLTAESRRVAANASESPSASELPAELHHRLSWWVAAALHERIVDRNGEDPEIDRAISEATQRCIAAHDEGERVEAVAVRLAAAIDARANEVPALLVEAIGDRRLALFIAVLAQAAGLDYEAARDITLDPCGFQLWLALRAVGVDHATIARIEVTLAEADRRREVEDLAESLDVIAQTSAAMARTALAPLLLHRDFRAAVAALARSDPR